MSGKGRRPSMTSIRCTNRLLLQIYKIKVEHNKSWESISCQLGRWFDQRCDTFRSLIEQVVRDVLRLQPADRVTYYDTPVDLDSPGKFCEAAGLRRCDLLGFFTELPPISVDLFTNGLLLELCAFSKKEKCSTNYLAVLINTLFPHFHLNAATISRHVASVRSKFQKLNKSKSRNTTAPNAYLEQCIECTPHIVIESTVMDDTTSESACTAETLTDAKTPEENHTEIDINILKEKISTLESMVLQSNKTIAVLGKTLDKSESKLRRQNVQVERLQTKLNKLKCKHDDCAASLKGYKNKTLYQSMRRKLRRYKKMVSSAVSQSNHVSIMTHLQKQIKCVKRSLANQKQVTKLHMLQKQECMKEQSILKPLLVEADAELSLLKSDTIVTRSDDRGKPYTENVEKCVMHLMGECDVPSAKCPNVIQAVSKWMFDKDIPHAHLPSSSTCINMMDHAHVLSKYQIAETINQSEHVDLHSDGTSRDQKKIIGQQLNCSEHGVLSTGWSSVAVEDSTTLLDNTIAMFDELSYVFDTGTPESEREIIHKMMLSKLFATMSDRSSVQKLFNEKLAAHCSNVLGTETDIKFLYCNAHFLLGLSSCSEVTLSKIEQEVASNLGHKFGRDNVDKFNHFRSSESCCARFIRTACDSFGPRGDEKNGCRQHWLAYCNEKENVCSKITSFRMNRFNNFFQGAASLYHHRIEIVDFLTNFKDKLNMKLESVLHDAKSMEIAALLRALGIMYYMVTGPFWKMLKGNVKYVDQHLYIQQMLKNFREWSNDATPLLQETCYGVFDQFRIEHDEVRSSLYVEQGVTVDAPLTKLTLEKLMSSFVLCTERQLNDFLPGGKFGETCSSEQRAAMQHCKLTNLVSENEFGDLDFSQFRRRHASLHFHSSIQIVKRNKTISHWLSSKSEMEQSKLLKIAGHKARELRLKHAAAEKAVVKRNLERMEEHFRKKLEKEASQVETRRNIVKAVKAHGGPCTGSKDVVKLLRTCKSDSQRLKVLKDEIRYLKQVLGIRDRRLVFGKKDVQTLADDLTQVLTVTLNNATSLPKSESDSESELPIATICNLKRKCTSHENGNVVKKAKLGDPKSKVTFSFCNQGMWVAVAYEEDFFIGEVIETHSESLATIQFLNRGYTDVFKWPQLEDVTKVESKFVFTSDFDVVSANNGRTWIVPEFNYIKELYHDYRQIHFS